MSQFVSFNNVIGNGKSYKVPIYQRDYSWDKDDWEDLWNDIEEIPKERNHYMGYLVLQPISGEDQAFEVIDGQQRLTTLSLLSLAVTALLKEWSQKDIERKDNQLRFEEITKRFLGNFSTSRLTLSSKLNLNRNNDDFYQSYLMNHRRPPALSKLKLSQRLLQKAFDYYKEKLSEKFSANPSGAQLAEFLEKTVGNGLVFTVIEVQNDLDAFKVFETLNARGVKLSTSDLLKNYLFSQAAKQGSLELEEAERRWQNISDTLAGQDSTTFVRHYWNSCNEHERQSTLFKAIKRKVDNAEETFRMLDTLEKNSVYYAAFLQPSDELWDKEERRHLTTLKLIEVTTCYSLMLAVLNAFARADFKLLLRELVAITFRYNLSGLNPNEAERAFSRAALSVASREVRSVREIVSQLKSIYVHDDNFEQTFATASLSTKRNKNLVKYILVQMENHLTGTEHQFEDATSTIEHILPENPGSVWGASFDPSLQTEFTHRIGNYTLLEASINNKLSNEHSFLHKSSAYKSSRYKMTHQFLTFEEWSPATLLIHQQQMAKWAKAIWTSSYLPQ
jgi:uncharacterized protein with ParB-like and HNH nuclease domain